MGRWRTPGGCGTTARTGIALAAAHTTLRHPDPVDGATPAPWRDPVRLERRRSGGLRSLPSSGGRLRVSGGGLMVTITWARLQLPVLPVRAWSACAPARPGDRCCRCRSSRPFPRRDSTRSGTSSAPLWCIWAMWAGRAGARVRCRIRRGPTLPLPPAGRSVRCCGRLTGCAGWRCRGRSRNAGCWAVTASSG